MLQAIAMGAAIYAAQLERKDKPVISCKNGHSNAIIYQKRHKDSFKMMIKERAKFNMAETLSTSSNTGPTSKDLIIDKKNLIYFLENQQTTFSNSIE